MKKVLIVVLMIFAAGCAKKYVKAPEGEQPVAPEEEVMRGVEEEEIEEARVIPGDDEDIESAEIQESLYEFQDALFDYDKYDIRPDTREVLDSVASWLSSHNDVTVLIEGHCDDRGTNEYNLALGERRARAARDYLLSRGVSHTRMNIITYGEERPICSEQNEECWQSNRRAHFVVVQ